jgi:hypothetical protein
VLSRFCLLALLLSLVACHPQQEVQHTLLSPSEHFPYLLVEAIPSVRPLSARWQSQTSHPFLYIGLPQDTLKLNYHATTVPSPPPLPGVPPAQSVPGDSLILRYAVDREANSQLKHWKLGYLAHLRLSIDTTCHIAAEEVLNATLRTDTASQWFAAYPVLLRNLDRDTITVGTGDYVPLQVEAQDERGQWRVIEENYASFCGVGVPLIFLPPGQIAVTSVLIPHGPFATRLRLRYGRTVSLPFRGHIHPRQFTSPFDASGNYQSAYVQERRIR